MVMTALSGIEVLGVLTSKVRFSPDNGAARFGEFWRDYLYVNQPAFHRLHSLVYEFVRHGLAHSFITKPMVVVTKHRDSGHLHRRDDNVLCVDALTLADDLETAYFQRLKPKIAGDFKANMEARFREFREVYWHDHAAKKNQLAKVPLRSLVFGPADTRVSGSPFVQVSTNLSTTGFDDPNG